MKSFVLSSVSLLVLQYDSNLVDAFAGPPAFLSIVKSKSVAPTTSFWPNSSTSCSHRRLQATRDPFSEISSRRSFVVSTFSFGLITGALVGVGMTANAKYGDSSNLELPSYIDYLIEKNSTPDDSKVLYKGVDPGTLLKRLQESERRLQEIDGLAEQKKWTQINGIVTGPLGTLSMTLNQIAGPESSANVKTATKKVKADVLAIGDAAAKKSKQPWPRQI
jgi:hypothetical protein